MRFQERTGATNVAGELARHQSYPSDGQPIGGMTRVEGSKKITELEIRVISINDSNKLLETIYVRLEQLANRLLGGEGKNEASQPTGPNPTSTLGILTVALEDQRQLIGAVMHQLERLEAL